MEAELSEADDDSWCATQRSVVIDYLGRQPGLVHGEVGDYPAWHIAPNISVWAIESVKSPGWVGWWAVAGDLPTDYCNAQDCRHPRLALRRIAETWLCQLSSTGDNQTTIGETGLSAELVPLLQSRAKLLLEFAANDDLWAE